MRNITTGDSPHSHMITGIRRERERERERVTRCGDGIFAGTWLMNPTTFYKKVPWNMWKIHYFYLSLSGKMENYSDWPLVGVSSDSILTFHGLILIFSSPARHTPIIVYYADTNSCWCLIGSILLYNGLLLLFRSNRNLMKYFASFDQALLGTEILDNSNSSFDKNKHGTLFLNKVCV